MASISGDSGSPDQRASECASAPANICGSASFPIRASTILPERNARSAASIKSFERAAAGVQSTTIAPHSSMASTTEGDRETLKPDPCSATARASA